MVFPRLRSKAKMLEMKTAAALLAQNKTSLDHYSIFCTGQTATSGKYRVLRHQPPPRCPCTTAIKSHSATEHEGSYHVE